jgi:hypothetical protein
MAPWSKVLEKLIVAQMVKEFKLFMEPEISRMPQA